MKKILLCSVLSAFALIACTEDEPNASQLASRTEMGNAAFEPFSKKVTRIVKNEWSNQGDWVCDEVYEFFYDELGRVIKTTQEEQELYAPGKASVNMETTHITYGDNTIDYRVAHTKNGVEANGENPSGSATLDELGRVVSGNCQEYDWDDDGTYEIEKSTYTLFYDAEGYLVRSVQEEMERGSRPVESLMGWLDGNLVEVSWSDDGQKFFDSVTYGSVLNKSNIDLLWFYVLDTDAWEDATGDPHKVFAMLGYTGNRSIHMPIEVIDGEDRETDRYIYETDSEGFITKITRKEVGYMGEYNSEELIITYE